MLFACFYTAHMAYMGLVTESSANGQLPCFRRMPATSHSCSRTTMATARTTCQPRRLLWTSMFRALLPAGYCCPSPCDSPSQPHVHDGGPFRGTATWLCKKAPCHTRGHRRTSRKKHSAKQNTLFIFLINATMFNAPPRSRRGGYCAFNGLT